MTARWLTPNIMTSNKIDPLLDNRYLGAAEMALAFNEEWRPAIARCDVICVNGTTVRETFTGTDGFLTRLVPIANQYGKAIDIVVGGPLGTVTFPTGAASAIAEMPAITRITNLGGSVAHLTLENPLPRVINGLGQTVSQAWDQVVEYMQTFHATHPGLPIGLLEQPILWKFAGRERYFTGVQTVPSDWDAAFDIGLNKLALAGESLAFLHADQSYDYSMGFVNSPNKDVDNWDRRVADWQTLAIAAGIPFGTAVNSPFGGGFWNGTFPDPPGPAFVGSNELFHERTLIYVEKVRDLVRHGVWQPLDYLSVQSFYYYPRDMAAAPYSFCDTFIAAERVWNAA